MSEFTLHKVDSAPSASRDILQNIEGAWGAVPNLHRLLAESPPTLDTYGTAFAAFENASFSVIEKQIVYLAISVANECGYCSRAHAALAADAGLEPGAIEAIESSQTLNDARYEALRLYVTDIVIQRGRVSPAATEAFLQAGFTRAQVLELILAVAVKTLSNYVDHVAGVPFDGAEPT